MGERKTTTLHSGRHISFLDGLRGLAVVTVVIYHLGITVHGDRILTGGYVGVDVFFVLSGFLITSLLLDELDRRGRVSLSAFYARRALRLFPALAVVIAFAIIAVFTFAPHFKGATIAGLPWVVLYVGNWDRGLENPLSLGLLTHTWSLAVEEQFYIIWPALCLLFFSRIRRRTVAGTSLLAAAVGVAVYRLAASHAGWSVSRVFDGLDTHSDGLLIGCAIAFFASAVAKSGRRRSVSPRVMHWLSIVAVIAIVGVALTCGYGKRYPNDLALTVGSFGTGILLWGLLTEPLHWMTTILESPVAVWVGKRSYGLYLWHFVIITAMNFPTATGFRLLRDCVIAVILSLMATVLSYRLVELPFLQLKKRFQPARDPRPVGPVEVTEGGDR